MNKKEKRAYLSKIYIRYHQADKLTKMAILDKFCAVCSYNHKYAVRLIKEPLNPPKAKPGFVEADTVALCGNSLAGDFIWCLDLTDIMSSWTDMNHHLLLYLEECKDEIFIYNNNGDSNWQLLKQGPPKTSITNIREFSKYRAWLGI